MLTISHGVLIIPLEQDLKAMESVESATSKSSIFMEEYSKKLDVWKKNERKGALYQTAIHPQFVSANDPGLFSATSRVIWSI
eukprot:5158600-Ditylum_brightwellii.AAC.1